MAIDTAKCSRRTLLKSSAAAGLTLAFPPISQAADEPARPVRFGMVADVHKDVMHDADARLKTFVKATHDRQLDFAIQMGDFCIPIPGNDAFMSVWRELKLDTHHVIGNHDMDGDGKVRPDKANAFAREEVAENWGMPARYYSWDVGGLHLVVLDGNDQGPGQQPYFRHVADDQAAWLTEDLAATNRPTLVFIHQSLERDDGVGNGAKIRGIFESANRAAGFQKVIACFSGHHHRDYVRRINEIYYPQVNSMSYHWLGGRFLQMRYSAQVDAEYPYIKYTAPYQDPLFAFVTVDLVAGKLTIEGRRSKFVGPSPWDLGADRDELDADTLVPSIGDRSLAI